MKSLTALISLLLLLMELMPPSCHALGPLVKVCGTRELKEVTESVCSTLGKRDTVFPILSQRIKREYL